MKLIRLKQFVYGLSRRVANKQSRLSLNFFFSRDSVPNSRAFFLSQHTAENSEFLGY